MANIPFPHGNRRSSAPEHVKGQSIADLMRELVAQLALPMPAGPAQEAYTLHVDGKPSVHVVHRPGDVHVSVICEAGMIAPSSGTEKLAALLALNYVDRDEISATVSLHKPTQAMIVWIRLRLRDLETIVLRQAIDSVQRTADAVLQILNDSPAKAVSGPARRRSPMITGLHT